MKTLIQILALLCIFPALTQAQSDTITLLYKGEIYSKQIEVKYPPEAIENFIYGTVIYKLHINIEGCLDSIIIVDSPHKVLSDEVKKAHSLLKCGWNPTNLWIEKKFVFEYQ